MARSKEDKRYWVVSPNLGNDETTVPEWRQASVAGHAAFMGYHSSDKGHGASGHKFAHTVKPGDIILIARRHQSEPEIVGFGVVRGNFQRSLKGVHLPYKPGSIRRLSPFLARSRLPNGMPLPSVLTWTRALAELRPTTKSAHKKLCDWLERELKRDAGWRNGNRSSDRSSRKTPKHKRRIDVKIGAPPGTFQEDYEVRTPQRVKTAKRREAALVARYDLWLKQRGRTLSTVLYSKLRCDGYEQSRHNLIEAKSSTSREHLRMAVGQLLDYGYQGKKKLGEAHKAVLVPKEPPRDLIRWLASLSIDLIWPEKGEFLDTANGQFT